MKLGIILGVYSLILWGLLIGIAWRRGLHEWRHNRANRLEKAKARVLDRRQDGDKYFLYLEFAGRQKEFQVGPEWYALHVGQEGMLHLKGGRFESFEVASIADLADDVYRRLVKD